MPRRRDPRTWVVPVLLVALGSLVLVLARTSECLSLGPTTPGAPLDQLCQSTVPVGAVVMTAICWVTAAVVWAVQRRR